MGLVYRFQLLRHTAGAAENEKQAKIRGYKKLIP
jgi:hypothetical protein